MGDQGLPAPARRLERDLIAAGESVVRVSPKLMAHVRDSARSFGKSDPIDGLAVARAALREPNLPIARLDGVERELRLLVDHREDLVAERTRIISRLRWHLHEIDPRDGYRRRSWSATAHLTRSICTCRFIPTAPSSDDWRCGWSSTYGCWPSRSTNSPTRSPSGSARLPLRFWRSWAVVR